MQDRELSENIRRTFNEAGFPAWMLRNRHYLNFKSMRNNSLFGPLSCVLIGVQVVGLQN